MYFSFRFHDKVVIEEELNELRSKNAPSWETTKYHLKLAKTNTSLRKVFKKKVHSCHQVGLRLVMGLGKG